MSAPPPALPTPHTPRAGFYASYAWLILRNVLGWGLILLSLAAGPLVPGPGGIPLFLIGFALISLPGKRRLIARILRGRLIDFDTRRYTLIIIAVALGLAIAAFAVFRPWRCGGSPARGDQPSSGLASRLGPPALEPLILVGLFAAAATAAWLLIRIALHAINGLLRLAPRVRRRIRPWFRRHHVRLLPPRWRRRLPHEHGHGPLRLKDEILKLGRARAQQDG
ncbi:MAG: hypothetical protein AB1716_21650 [Planctomycetota bacterium]